MFHTPQRFVHLLTVMAVLLLLAACGGKGAEPVREPMELEILFTAEKDMNPNAKGRPSPLAVQIFELKATGQFEEADYFSLQTDAKTVLGEEFLGVVDSFVIRPGGRKDVRKSVLPGTTALGFIAGYRDMGRAVWQGVHPLPLPPETGWFSSPVKVQLHIRLQASDMQLIPKR